jgi:hypothetical protein
MLTVTQIQLLPVWGNFSDFSSKIIKNRPLYFLSGVSIVYRYRDTATSGLGEKFLISRQKSSEVDHISFGPVSLLFTVTEIELLPVWVKFSDFSSKIIRSRPLSVWSVVSIVNFYRDTSSPGLG